MKPEDCPYCGSSLKVIVPKTSQVKEIRCGMCNEIISLEVGATHTQARQRVKSEPHKEQK